MKTNYYVIIFLSLLFSCSVNEDNSINEPNAAMELEPGINEEIANSAPTQDPIGNFTESSSAYAVTTFLRTRSSATNNSNGITVFYSADGIDYAFTMEDGRTLVVEVPAEDGKITALPNGRYKFKTHATDPVCYIINRYYEIEYSNYCMDKRQGVFNYNVVSDALVTTASNGGLVYLSTEPYFSASVINYVTKLNNSSFELDDNEIPMNCGDASEEVSVQLKKLEGNQNQDGEMKFKLTIR